MEQIFTCFIFVNEQVNNKQARVYFSSIFSLFLFILFANLD